ncbi:MAG: transposase [Deltaproteobacteria bacterium]|nr:transposase [Deltaproteobacteria bacterium]
MAQQGEPAVVDLKNWQSLKSTLPVGWEEIAKKLGLGPSDSGPHNASQVRAETRVHTLLTMVAWNLSLRMTSGLFASAGIHSVSHVGIHGWLKSSVAPFEAFLRLMVGAGGVFAPERWAGYRVRAIDATTAQRPGATGTTARIHLALRLSDMQVDEVKVTNCKTGETFRNFRTSRGALDVADRGYANPPSIAAAVDQGGDVLVRWNFASLPLQMRGGGQQVDVHRATRKLTPGQRRELWVEACRTNGPSIPGRLIIERLPNDQAEKARQRVRADDGGPLALQMAPFVMLFTTVPAARLTACQLLKLYRLRWQVELQFKRDKSVTGLDRLPNFRDDTIKAWLLAKLVLGQMARRLLNLEPAQDGTASDRSQPSSPLPVAMPWQAAVAGWVLVRIGLFAVRLEHVALLLRRLHDQLARLKTSGRKAGGQIGEFLAGLAPMTSAGRA